MPGYLVALYLTTAPLGEARNEVWTAHLEELRPFPDLFNPIARGTGLAEVIVQV
ncbi:hypothetical protein ACFY1B_49575 [Streptomyces mirabilis]|uniref:hypothetical protein n=1 Tax=Streptomyces mirabilis TaxID=68239 RepID=UPI00368DE85F